MGNHQVGRAMERMAIELTNRRTKGETALGLLDTICSPYRETDAKFESTHPTDPHLVHPDYGFSTDPAGPIGKLIREAFAPDFPEEIGDGEDVDDYFDAWFEGPYKEFRTRYGFW